tara:strand:- start:1853 stop:3052 length:1200 start_codon:yes stop_codon:yes gene_type:complete
MANTTTADFIITNPGTAGVRILFGTGSNQGKVQGLTVSTTDCNQNNYAAEFEQLEVFNIFSTAFPIASRQAQTSHFYFEIHPPVAFDTGSITTPTVCKDTSFVPSTVVDFTNNVYNVTFNSDQELRSSQYQFVVDSNNSGSSPRPSNIKAILADTAVTASVQDSNYSSLAVIRGRYQGTKTDTADYGIEPAFGAEVKVGALYDINVTSQSICTTSETDRRLVDYYFVNNLNPNIRSNFVPSGSFQLDTPNVRYQTITKGQTLTQTAGTTGTEVYLEGQTSSLGITSGDYIRIFKSPAGVGTAEEFMKIESLHQKPGNNIPAIISASVKRNAISSVFDSTITMTGNGPHRVHQVRGDKIYSVDKNKLFKITEKKLYNRDTEEVFYVGEEGYILFTFGSCN